MKRGVAGAIVLTCMTSIGCAPVLDANSALWTVDMAEPLALQNPVSGFFEIEDWCPALYFNNVLDAGGQPVVAALTRAPHRVNAPFFSEDEDIYVINPFFNAGELGAPLAFDIGPIGTFYEDAPHAFEVSGAQGEVDPPAINVTRRIVQGSAKGDDEFNVDLEYTFDCGSNGTVTRAGVTCECSTRTISLEAVASSASSTF
jgi:hypothetical protein